MNSSFRAVVLTCLLAGLSIAFYTHAADITNPGFEQDREGWTQGDPSGSGTAISKKAHSGEKSVKLTEKSSYAAQVVAVQHNTTYRLSAFVLGTGNLGAKVRAQKTIDMSASGYDVANDYMYFKAGVYNQNKSGDQEDYVQATFYELENSHTGYDF